MWAIDSNNVGRERIVHCRYCWKCLLWDIVMVRLSPLNTTQSINWLIQNTCQTFGKGTYTPNMGQMNDVPQDGHSIRWYGVALSAWDIHMIAGMFGHLWLIMWMNAKVPPHSAKSNPARHWLHESRNLKLFLQLITYIDLKIWLTLTVCSLQRQVSVKIICRVIDWPDEDCFHLLLRDETIKWASQQWR